MALQLGQVEIGSAAPGQQLLGIVEKIEAEVEEGAGHGLAVHLDVLLGQGPAPGTHDEGGQGVVEPVVLALGTLEGQGAADGLGEVLLALQGGAPGGAVSVLEIGHETLGAGVEGVDDHLAVHGPGDLHPAILEIGGGGAHPPVPGANFGGAGQEVQGLPAIQPLLPGDTRGQEFPPARAEATLQVHHEFQRCGGEDLLQGGGHGGKDLDLGHGLLREVVSEFVVGSRRPLYCALQQNGVKSSVIKV